MGFRELVPSVPPWLTMPETSSSSLSFIECLLCEVLTDIIFNLLHNPIDGQCYPNFIDDGIETQYDQVTCQRS